MSAAQKTRTLAGHKITLTKGIRYLALGAVAGHGRNQDKFPVTITLHDKRTPVLRFEDLSYQEQRKLLRAFNNRSEPYSGRVW